MALAIITIYISKCAQMNPQQLPETSKFYSRCKKCDIEKTLGVWVPPPLVARRLIRNKQSERFRSIPEEYIYYTSSFPSLVCSPCVDKTRADVCNATLIFS